MEWKSEYAFIFFCVFVGAGFQFIHAKNGDSLAKRLYSQLVSVIFVGLVLIGIFLAWLKWSLWIPVILGIPGGIVGEKFLRLWMIYGNGATGFLDFIDRMRKAYKAAKIDSTDELNETFK